MENYQRFEVFLNFETFSILIGFYLGSQFSIHSGFLFKFKLYFAKKYCSEFLNWVFEITLKTINITETRFVTLFIRQ